MNHPVSCSPRAALAFLAAAILICVTQGCGTVRQRVPGPAASSPAANHINVMTFNIRYGTANDGDDAWPRRRELFFDTIRAANPDIIGFQEALAFQVHEAMTELDGYKVVYACRDDGKDKGESCAILYRAARFTLEDSGTFWLSDTPEVVNSNTWDAVCTRICTWVRLTDVDTHKHFYVFNTHFDLTEEVRIKEMDLLLARIAARARTDEPVILTGDFNATELSPVIARAAASFTDTYCAVNPCGAAREKPAGTFNDFKNKLDGRRIDYIFVTPGVPAEAAEIIRTTRDGRNASDHFAVTARVRVP